MKSVSRTLTLTPSVYPYPHHFLCGDLQLDTNMGGQLSTRELEPLFITQLDTTREDYTLFMWLSTKILLHYMETLQSLHL